MPMSERLAGCAGGQAFVMPRPRGAAIYRAALLIERLRNGFGPQAGGAPVRMLVIDNSHYATAGAGGPEGWPDPRSDLGSPDHLRYHLLQNPDSILYSTPAATRTAAFAESSGSFPFAEARLLEWRSFRRMLYRRGLLPLRRALLSTNAQGDTKTKETPGGGSYMTETRDADWQVAARFVPGNEALRAELLRHKTFRQDLAITAYGSAARALAEKARERPCRPAASFAFYPCRRTRSSIGSWVFRSANSERCAPNASVCCATASQIRRSACDWRTNSRAASSFTIRSTITRTAANAWPAVFARFCEAIVIALRKCPKARR